MEHEEAAPLLPEHLEGSLPEDVDRGVRDHAAACEECRALMEACETLVHGFGAESAGARAAHPPVEDLVDLALERAPASGADLATVSSHARACPSCSAEVEAVRRTQAEVESASPTPAVGFRRRAAPHVPRWAALAAGVVALVLAYPAFLGLREAPRLRGESASLRGERETLRAETEALTRSLKMSEERLQQVTGWTGSITVPLLAAPARSGTAEETVIPVSEGQPFICLAVDPGLPEREPGPGSYVVTVSTPDGGPVWSASLAASEMRRQLSQAGSLAFLVPSEKIPPGRHRITIEWRGEGPARAIVSLGFIVERAPVATP